MQLRAYQHHHFLHLFLIAVIWIRCPAHVGVVEGAKQPHPWKLQLHDTHAVIGKYFSFPINLLEPAPEGYDSIQYQVSEVGAGSIPRWLVLDQSTNTLQGVPLISDEGFYLIKVAAVSQTLESSVVLAEDVFAIDVLLESQAHARQDVLYRGEVRPQQVHKVAHSPRSSNWCKSNEVSAQVSVIFEARINSLDAGGRIAMLSNLSFFVALPIHELRMSAKHSKTIDRLQGNDVIAAGPGNVQHNELTGEGLTLSWPLPCATHALLNQFTKVLARNVASGHFVSTMSYNVLGWYVVRLAKSARESRGRQKRDAERTVVPTPQPSHSATIITATSLITATDSMPSVSFPTQLVSVSSAVLPASSSSERSRTIASQTFTLSISFPISSLSALSVSESDFSSISNLMVMSLSSQTISSLGMTSRSLVSTHSSMIQTEPVTMVTSGYTLGSLVVTPSESGYVDRSGSSQLEPSTPLLQTSGDGMSLMPFTSFASTNVLSTFQTAFASDASNEIVLSSLDLTSLSIGSSQTTESQSRILFTSSISIPFSTTVERSIPNTFFVNSSPGITSMMPSRPVTETFQRSSEVMSQFESISASKPTSIRSPQFSVFTEMSSVLPRQSSSVVLSSERTVSIQTAGSSTAVVTALTDFLTSLTAVKASSSPFLASSGMIQISDISMLDSASLTSSQSVSSLGSSSLTPYPTIVPTVLTEQLSSLATRVLSSFPTQSALLMSSTVLLTSYYRETSRTNIMSLASSPLSFSEKPTANVPSALTVTMSSTEVTGQVQSLDVQSSPLVSRSDLISPSAPTSGTMSVFSSSLSGTFQTRSGLSLTSDFMSSFSVLTEPTSGMPSSTTFAPSSVVTPGITVSSFATSPRVSSGFTYMFSSFSMSVEATAKRSTVVEPTVTVDLSAHKTLYTATSPFNRVSDLTPLTSTVAMTSSFALTEVHTQSTSFVEAISTHSATTTLQSDLTSSLMPPIISTSLPGSISHFSSSLSRYTSVGTLGVKTSLRETLSEYISTVTSTAYTSLISSETDTLQLSSLFSYVQSTSDVMQPSSFNTPTSLGVSVTVFPSSPLSMAPEMTSSRSISAAITAMSATTISALVSSSSDIRVVSELQTATSPVQPESTSSLSSMSVLSMIHTPSFSEVQSLQSPTSYITSPSDQMESTADMQTPSLEPSSSGLSSLPMVPSSLPMSSSFIGLLSTLNVTATSTSVPVPSSTMPTSALPSITMPGLSPILSSTPSLPSLPTSVSPMISSAEMVSSQILLSPSSSDHDMISTLTVTSALPTTPPSDITTEPQNQPPYLWYPVDEIVTSSGDVLQFPIPEDTFMDIEDGLTRNLHLNLLDADSKPVSQSNWLQLDADQQILLGVPLSDNFTRASYNSYFLSATDTGGLIGYDAFVVNILERPADFTHEYIITLADDFHGFVNDGWNIVHLCQRIANFLGDSGADAISVDSVRRGSVVITYSNKTISRSGCDSETINAVFYQLVDGNGSLSEDFRESLQPEFSVTGVERIFLGPCLISTTPMTTNMTLLPVGQSKHLLLTVVPAVIIALSFLLFCIIILFCLYKRKRRGEEFLLQDEKKIYAKSRKPIYLDGELDNKEVTGIANPIVLPDDFEPVKNFRPPRKAMSSPLPKPQYRRPPPEYRLPDFAKVNLEMDKLDLLASASEPPKYSSWPAHSDLPFSDLHGAKPPPLYRPPPPYQSQDSGLFNESDI